jgi:hypothetical protein
MSNNKHLGEFEHVCLISIMRMNGGTTIEVRDFLKKMIDRRTSRDAINETFNRMNIKNYVSKSKINYLETGYMRNKWEITTLGRKVLKRAKSDLDVLWRTW